MTPYVATGVYFAFDSDGIMSKIYVDFSTEFTELVKKIGVVYYTDLLPNFPPLHEFQREGMEVRWAERLQFVFKRNLYFGDVVPYMGWSHGFWVKKLCPGKIHKYFQEAGEDFCHTHQSTVNIVNSLLKGDDL